MTFKWPFKVTIQSVWSNASKWSSITFSNCDRLENISEKHDFTGKISKFGGFVAFGTPCSHSFQDKLVILYIFGKARLRGIFWLPVEPDTTYLAPSIGENVKKYLFLKNLTLRENRKNIVRFFDKNRKNKYISIICTIFPNFYSNKK